MARRGPRKRAAAAPPGLPDNTCWIESDRYDRHAYGQLRRDAASLRELERAGEALVPHFPSLLQDVFCLLFKYNIIFADEADVLPSASVNRTLLNALHQGEVSRILRELTLLDEARAGLCALLVGEGLLATLKSEKPWTRHDMMDTWKLRQQEEEFQKTRELLENAGELAEQEDGAGKEDALAKLQERLKGRLRGEAASIRQKRRQLTDDLERVEAEVRARAYRPRPSAPPSSLRRPRKRRRHGAPRSVPADAFPRTGGLSWAAVWRATRSSRNSSAWWAG